VKFGKGRGDYAWIVCTGYSSRWLAGVLGFHGDDKGLVLPPSIAPLQVIIVPIIKGNKKKVLSYAQKVMKELEVLGVRVDLDDRDQSVGRKFYDWEIKGVPLRIEVGSKEVKSKSLTIVERDTGKKRIVKSVKKISKMLDDFHKRVYAKAKKQLKNQIKAVADLKNIMKVVNNKGVAKMYWCESRKCYDKIMKLGEGQGLDAFGTDLKKAKLGKCIVCGKPTSTILYAAKTY
jgi:prolyl-tRNA synthetase